MKLLNVRKVSDAKDFLAHYKLDYELDNGKPYVYEMVSRFKNHTMETIGKTDCAAVTIFARTPDDQKALFIKEFRMPLNKDIWALPAGLIDPGESAQEAALRELREETGYSDVTVDNVLKPAYSTPGLTDESVSIVFCTINDLESKEALRESTESIESFILTKDDAKDLLLNSDEIGTRTQLLIMYWLKEELF